MQPGSETPVRPCRACGRFTDIYLLGMDDLCPRCTGRVYRISNQIIRATVGLIPYVVAIIIMGVFSVIIRACTS